MKHNRKHKSIEKREEKWTKLAIALENKKEGEFAKPTPLAKTAKIHKDTANYIMDGYDTLNQIGIMNFRDEEGNWTGTLKSKEFINTTNSLREIRKKQIDQANQLDQIELKIVKLMQLLENINKKAK